MKYFVTEDTEDFEVSEDTDMLRKGTGRGDGRAGLTWRTTGGGRTSGATVRGRAPTEVHVQARHEPEARWCAGRGCLLHAHDFNTHALGHSKPLFERLGSAIARKTQSAPVSCEIWKPGRAGV
ncbi:hypothetical protein GCM10010220_40070 [Streptomyces parvulus]|nr:hypothetical protein GCM10010220_40070 [Streptomyces parvulus]